MFKTDWEKTSSHHKIAESVIEKMIQASYPHKKLLSHELIAGGCANLNYKVTFAHEADPVLLRIYLRDANAALIEEKLGSALKNIIPLPQTYHINKIEGYCFAITQFMPGIPLRDLLLRNEPYNLYEIMYDVGIILSKIATLTPAEPDIFFTELNYAQGIPDESIKQFSLEMLNHPQVAKYLSMEMRSSLNRCIQLLPDHAIIQKNLVHADFDPANILVKQCGDKWKISAVLDWEFAYAGSWTDDVATMLRYGHKMPGTFKTGFLTGLTDGGINIPNDLDLLIHQYNIAALLDAIPRHPLDQRPNIYKDILELLQNILSDVHS